MKNLLFLLLDLVVSTSCGQNAGNNDFQKFATKQDSLMMSAYNKHDVNTYQKLLTEFLSKYDGDSFFYY